MLTCMHVCACVRASSTYTPNWSMIHIHIHMSVPRGQKHTLCGATAPRCATSSNEIESYLLIRGPWAFVSIPCHLIWLHLLH